MKILHYINNLGSGGAEKLLTDILPLMNEKGHEVHLIYANGNRNVENFEKIISNAGVRVLNFDKAFFNPTQVFKLIKILKREKYDVVHAHLSPTQIWLALASYFIPKTTYLVKTEHNVSNNRRKIWAFNKIEKFIYNRYSTIIAITEEVKTTLVSWLKTSIPVVIIPNGVNLAQIESMKKDGNNDLLFEKGNYNILMVGRFNGAKDQNTLIKAINLLPDSHHVFFAGEGLLIEESKKFAEDLSISNRVHFLGMRTDVYTLMNRADLNVLSSNFEGLSGVTLESLASGKPFIGSNVPGINNIVPSEEFLFEKQNAEELSELILLLSNDPQKSQNMVNQATEFVKDFDINIMVSKYLTCYQHLLAN